MRDEPVRTSAWEAKLISSHTSNFSTFNHIEWQLRKSVHKTTFFSTPKATFLATETGIVHLLPVYRVGSFNNTYKFIINISETADHAIDKSKIAELTIRTCHYFEYSAKHVLSRPLDKRSCFPTHQPTEEKSIRG